VYRQRQPATADLTSTTQDKLPLRRPEMIDPKTGLKEFYMYVRASKRRKRADKRKFEYEDIRAMVATIK
jgi:hypothetical protein